MWNLAQFSTPLFFSRSNVSRDAPRMRTRETVGVRWRPFAFWFYKRRNWENMVEWGIWFMFWLLHSSQTTTAKKAMIHQTWNVSGLVHSWVIFYLSLHIFLLVKTKSCCLDDNFDLRINHKFGQAIASVSVGEMCQNDTDCFVCCLLTRQQWIRDTFVGIHILNMKINRLFQCIHFTEIDFWFLLSRSHLLMLWKGFH
jgi:hypothetical protein